MNTNLEFPSDEEYKEFVKSLHKYSELRLTCGNCGVFVLALKEVFGVGKIYDIDNGSHILLKYNNKYYDGECVYTFDELRDGHWGRYMRYTFCEYNDNDVAVKKVLSNTSHNQTISFFTQIIFDEFKRIRGEI